MESAGDDALIEGMQEALTYTKLEIETRDKRQLCNSAIMNGCATQASTSSEPGMPFQFMAAFCTCKKTYSGDAKHEGTGV